MNARTRRRLLIEPWSPRRVRPDLLTEPVHPQPAVDRWAPIIGFSRYEASTEGRVRMIGKTKPLKPTLVRHGNHLILQVNVTRDSDGKRLPTPVGRLVLLAHVGPPPRGHETRHLRDDPYRNRLCDLAWGTRRANVRDAMANGRCKRAPRKLDPAKAAAVRALHQAGQRTAVIARSMGIGYVNAWAIVTGRTWKSAQPMTEVSSR